MTIELIAGVDGVFTSLAPILQARRMRRRGSSADVSLIYMTVLEIGFALYLTYGISIGNRVLIATNSVSIVATSITLSIAISYRRPRTATSSPFSAPANSDTDRRSTCEGLLNTPQTNRKHRSAYLLRDLRGQLRRPSG